MNIIAEHGKQGFIVPVSSISTEGYITLQEVISKRKLFVSSYDDRPAHLFDGLDKNTLSIILSSSITDKLVSFSSRLCRWNSTERSTLFDSLQYCLTPKCNLNGCLPKIGSKIEKNIWEKIWSGDIPVVISSSKGSNFPVYYSRKINSFLQILNFVPEVRDGKGNIRPPSEFKDICFPSIEKANAVYCCFSSTLFRWFMDVVSDGSHVNKREINNFPFEPSKLPRLEQFNNLASKLTKKIIETSETRVMRYIHDTLTVQCTIPKYSKSIIDKIDHLLAKHYEFSDEELDFIINYDIKYRMGIK